MLQTIYKTKLSSLHPRSMDRNYFDDIQKQITTAVENCYFGVKLGVVFTTRQLLPAIKKNVLLSSHHCRNLRLLNNTSPNLSLIASSFEAATIFFVPAKLTVISQEIVFFHESAIIGQHAMRFLVERQQIIYFGLPLFYISLFRFKNYVL